MPAVSERFVSLVFGKNYDEAEALLRARREAISRDDSPQLAGVEEALRAEIERLGTSSGARRQILAGCYMMADQLREQEYWNEAESIFHTVIDLSLSMNEAFFLNDARLRRAVCLKRLGKIREYQRAKAEVPVGTRILIDGVDWRVEDL